MTWLAPWFLVAGLAVAGPILFHLWRRTPRGKRLFSSTMFLAASPPRVTHRSRIEHWLLLCLRALALILLAVAFARPVWQHEASLPALAAPDKTVAILVDVSASLQRRGFLESLQQQLTTKIAKLPAETQIGLFVFDHDWRATVPFEQSPSGEPAARRQLVQQQLAKLQPGWGATRLGAALVATMQAVREFQSTRIEGEPAEIWLASDLAAGADLTGISSIDWPETTRLKLIMPAVAPGSNAGLQWVDQQSQLPNSPPRVRISNAQSSTRDRFQLGWDTTTNSEVHVPAGQSRTFPIPNRPADLPEETPLTLSGDDHEFDNRLWSTTERKRELRVVYLGSESADDITAPRFFLEQALAGVAKAEVTVEVAANSQATGGGSLVIWTDAAVEPPAWVRTAVEQGAALLAVPRTVDDARAMAAYLGVIPDEIAEAEVKNYSLLQELDWEDPLFSPFAQARFADFSGVHFWKHRRFKLPNSFTGRVLARFDDGDPYLIDQPLGDGRVWIMTSGWHPADSQLARSTKFAPLLEQLLELASPLRRTSARTVVGADLQLPAGEETPWTIAQPDETPDEADDGVYRRANLPGVYAATNGSETIRFAVNVPPAESKTDPLPAETLERLGAVTLSKTAEQRETLSLAARRQLQWEEVERRQMLWRWCLLGVGLLVLAETLLAARRLRTAPEPSETVSHDAT